MWSPGIKQKGPKTFVAWLLSVLGMNTRVELFLLSRSIFIEFSAPQFFETAFTRTLMQFGRGGGGAAGGDGGGNGGIDGGGSFGGGAGGVIAIIWLETGSHGRERAR